MTSPQAFEGLRLAGRKVRRPDLTLATMDHNVPTTGIGLPIKDEVSAKQMEALRSNCEEFGIALNEWGAIGQGIVHVIGPEMGLTRGARHSLRRLPHRYPRRVRGPRVRHRDERGRARPRDPDAPAATA